MSNNGFVSLIQTPELTREEDKAAKFERDFNAVSWAESAIVEDFVTDLTSLTVPLTFTSKADGLHFNADTISSGLVAHYKFNGNATDSAGNNNGSVSGATVQHNGKLGKCYTFNGVGDTIGITSPYTFSTSQTISMWVKPSEVDNYRSFFGNDDTFNYVRMRSGAEATQLQGETSTNGDEFFLNAGETIFTVGTWTHMTLVWKANKVFDLYINGVYKASSSATTDDELIIKHFGKGYDSYPFKGDMDDVRIYNRILTSSEILSLSQNTSIVSDNYSSMVSTSEVMSDPTGYSGNTTTHNPSTSSTFTGDSPDKYFVEITTAGGYGTAKCRVVRDSDSTEVVSNQTITKGSGIGVELGFSFSWDDNGTTFSKNDAWIFVANTGNVRNAMSSTTIASGTVPDVEVSFDGGTTWVDSPNNTQLIEDTNWTSGRGSGIKWRLTAYETVVLEDLSIMTGDQTNNQYWPS